MSKRSRKMANKARESRKPIAISCRHCKEFYTPLPPENKPHRDGTCTE